ncbi:MAG: YCF48-related protein, partial [Ignavibacteria bacterium]
MKKIIYILLITHCSLLIGNSQWVLQNSGVTSHLYNVQFVNRYTGWVIGANSTILKTTNSGNNWIQQSVTLSGPKNLYGLSMVSPDTGY